MSNIKLIFAKSRDGFIGKGGKLPWHIPQDLAMFREKTKGDVIVMGRRTWESIPAMARPLDDRVNIVLSSDPEYYVTEGVLLYSSLHSVLPIYKDRTVWIIGGQELLRLGMQYASEMIVTEVDVDVKGDALAPIINEDDWDIKLQVIYSVMLNKQITTVTEKFYRRLDESR